MNTITLELPDELAAAVATPEGMKRVRQMIEAEFGTPLGEAVMVVRTDERGAPIGRDGSRVENLSLFEELVAKSGKQSLEETLEKLKDFAPKGVVLDDSRESYYADDNGKLRGMDGFGVSSLGATDGESNARGE